MPPTNTTQALVIMDRGSNLTSDNVVSPERCICLQRWVISPLYCLGCWLGWKIPVTNEVPPCDSENYHRRWPWQAAASWVELQDGVSSVRVSSHDGRTCRPVCWGLNPPPAPWFMSVKFRVRSGVIFVTIPTSFLYWVASIFTYA